MSPEKQRVAIAEWCGDEGGPAHFCVKCQNLVEGPPPSEGHAPNCDGSVFLIPTSRDYLHDLNAIKEAIDWAPEEVQKAMRAEVWRLGSQMQVLPPASVFAEALLRVIGKWED